MKTSNTASRFKRVVLYTSVITMLALGTSACNEFNTNGRKKAGKSQDSSGFFGIGGSVTQYIYDFVVPSANAQMRMAMMDAAAPLAAEAIKAVAAPAAAASYCSMPRSTDKVLNAAKIANFYGYNDIMTPIYNVDDATFSKYYSAYSSKDPAFIKDFSAYCEPVVLSNASPNSMSVDACVLNSSTGKCAALTADSVMVAVVPVGSDDRYYFDFGSNDPSKLYASQVMEVAVFDRNASSAPAAAVVAVAAKADMFARVAVVAAEAVRSSSSGSTYGGSSYAPIRTAVAGKFGSDFVAQKGGNVVPVSANTTAVATFKAQSYSQPPAVSSAINNMKSSDFIAALQAVSSMPLDYDAVEAAGVDAMDNDAVLKYMLDSGGYGSYMSTIKSKVESGFADMIAYVDKLRATNGDSSSVFGANSVAQNNLANDLLANVKNASSITDAVKALATMDSFFGTAGPDFKSSLESNAAVAQNIIYENLMSVIASGKADAIQAAYNGINDYYNNYGAFNLPNLGMFDEIYSAANAANAEIVAVSASDPSSALLIVK